MPIVEYDYGPESYTPGANNRGWKNLHIPEHGHVRLYPDGLLNVVDRNGRVVEVDHDVCSIRPGNAWTDETDRLHAEPETQILTGDKPLVVE